MYTVFVLLNAHCAEVMIGCAFIYWPQKRRLLHRPVNCSRGISIPSRAVCTGSVWKAASGERGCAFNRTCALNRTNTVLSMGGTWVWASVTTSEITLPLSLRSLRALLKPRGSMFGDFRAVSLLSTNAMAMICPVDYSMRVYWRYWAECAGLSLRPSPKEWMYSWNNLNVLNFYIIITTKL